MITQLRTQHPFHTYDAILAQPDAFHYVIDKNQELINKCSDMLARSYERLFIVGIGTSYHAAQVGGHLLRLYGGNIFAQAIHSFDFALYGSRISSQDAVICISHRGNKLYSINSLKRAKEFGCFTIFITGENASIGFNEADIIFHTVPQDKSAAHTVSYIGAIAILSALAGRICNYRTKNNPLSNSFLSQDVPNALKTALTTEQQIAQLAHKYINRRHIWLVGGGANAITAQEIALKIKETSYLPSEGMSTESMLHGAFQCAEAEDLFILIAPNDAAQKRTLELAKLVQEIGVHSLIISDETGYLSSELVTFINVPRILEPFCTLTCLVPLQLFTYYLALERGTNPDSFRLEDPRFARARALIQL